MNQPPGATEQGSSTRPYLLRALHDWCTDNGFTPYIAVLVDDQVRVPMEYVKNGEIVLNVGFEATSGLKLGNETIEFRARFGGTPRDIMVPVDHVVAIYARENGQGMAFPAPVPPPGVTGEGVPHGGERADATTSLRLASREPAEPGTPAKSGEPDGDETPPPQPQPPTGGPRPRLKRVK